MGYLYKYPFKGFRMIINPSKRIQFSPDGKKLLSCEISGDVTIIDIDKDKLQIQSWLGQQRVSACCWFGNEEFIITCSGQKSICIWKAENQELVAGFVKYNQDAKLFSISPCGNFLVSASLDKVIKIWYLGDKTKNFKGNRMLKEFYVENFINFIVWSSDGKSIIAGDEGGQMLILDREKIILCENVHKEGVTALDASRKGNFVISGSKSKLIIFKL
ncbi:unnamed protein product [Blepharisma stoltei]|uniref:Uncharacterized protein n=1 Tax=Blepharisma stoltei TaxID=1481888 RepID=A0AAU9IRV6_9CILI|nr:unnamed protein product [Blepharisma stoltei]